MCGLCHNKKSKQAGCIASAQTPSKELVAGFDCTQESHSHELSTPNQTMPYPLVAYQTNPLTTSLLLHFSWLLHLSLGYQMRSQRKPFFQVKQVMVPSGFNCQLMVTSAFEGAQDHDITPVSICHHHCVIITFNGLC